MVIIPIKIKNDFIVNAIRFINNFKKAEGRTGERPFDGCELIREKINEEYSDEKRKYLELKISKLHYVKELKKLIKANLKEEDYKNEILHTKMKKLADLSNKVFEEQVIPPALFFIAVFISANCKVLEEDRERMKVEWTPEITQRLFTISENLQYVQKLLKPIRPYIEEVNRTYAERYKVMDDVIENIISIHHDGLKPPS